MDHQMKAVGFRRYGGPEVLEPLEVPRPTLAADSLLVRVAAAGINPADTYIREGRFRLFTGRRFPIIPGADLAGVVEAVGSAVTRFKPGDWVCAMQPSLSGRAYAEYAAVREDHAAHVPTGMSLLEAGAMPLAALTALQGLRDLAGLKRGDRVLVNGASGGVGIFAVQIAKAMGAAVTATSSARNQDFVRDLGADETLDYAGLDYETQRDRFDVVYDAVGLLAFREVRPALRREGIMVTTNFLRANPLERRWLMLTSRQRLNSALVRPSGDDLRALNAWFTEGRLRVVLDHCLPWTDAAEAHRLSETRRTRGKIVLIVDEALATRRAG